MIEHLFVGDLTIFSLGTGGHIWYSNGTSCGQTFRYSLWSNCRQSYVELPILPCFSLKGLELIESTLQRLSSSELTVGTNELEPNDLTLITQLLAQRNHRVHDSPREPLRSWIFFSRSIHWFTSARLCGIWVVLGIQ
jgi:hypothetical protein